MRRLSLLLIIGLAAFILGGVVIYQVLRQREVNEQRAEATVLLEKVRQVMQLVTVEGQFSEIYNEENFREVTLYLPLPSTWRFSKSALLQVEGKVLVGYDLEKVSITVDSANRVLTLANLPQPQILAIDHQVIYRDLEESFFNSFEPSDYTQLNRNAKEVLRRQAYESGLIDQAAGQGNAMIESIRYMAEAVGYRVVVEAAPLAPVSVERPDQ